ncbi:hypothetical protein MTO96_050614 [Rhipicephalus appendiculatus]
MLTHLHASGCDKSTSFAGPSVANVGTQCHVEVGIRGTQVALKPASRSTGVQTGTVVCHFEFVVRGKRKAKKRASRSTRVRTRPAVRHIEVDEAPKPASTSTGVHKRPTVVWLRSSTPCPEPSLVRSEPSLTFDDPEDETYKPKLSSSEAH